MILWHAIVIIENDIIEAIDSIMTLLLCIVSIGNDIIIIDDPIIDYCVLCVVVTVCIIIIDLTNIANNLGGGIVIYCVTDCVCCWCVTFIQFIVYW